MVVGDAGSVSQWVMSSSSWMGQATPTCAGRRTALAGPASSCYFIWCSAALLTLVRLFSRLPAGVSQAYARLLNTATTPFDAVNYVGSCSMEPSSDVTRMAAMFDRVIRVLYRRLDT